jgi:hypothetical protein
MHHADIAEIWTNGFWNLIFLGPWFRANLWNTSWIRRWFKREYLKDCQKIAEELDELNTTDDAADILLSFRSQKRKK